MTKLNKVRDALLGKGYMLSSWRKISKDLSKWELDYYRVNSTIDNQNNKYKEKFKTLNEIINKFNLEII